MEIIFAFILIIILVLISLIFIFGDHRVDDGYIVGKAHHPMRAIQYWDNFLHRYTLRYLPERYVIYVADCKGVEEITVTEAEFELYSKGQEWQRK